MAEKMEEIMFGGIEFADFKGLTKMPQRAASAWSSVESGLTGASFKALLFVGTQVTKGTDYWFIVEETRITNPPHKYIAKLAINEFGGKYKIVPSSIKIIF